MRNMPHCTDALQQRNYALGSDAPQPSANHCTYTLTSFGYCKSLNKGHGYKKFYAIVLLVESTPWSRALRD